MAPRRAKGRRAADTDTAANVSGVCLLPDVLQLVLQKLPHPQRYNCAAGFLAASACLPHEHGFALLLG